MRYVKHAEGTVKGLVKVDLAERTLIFGPNWSHKSAIVNTVELALTGAASDVVGRAVVKDAAMLESLGNEIGVTAAVVLSDGTEVEWRKEVGKKATGPAAKSGAVPKALFPLREVREALAGNPQTVRQFFLRLAAGAVTWEEVLARIPSPLHGRLWSPPGVMPAVDRLLASLEYAQDRLREARAAAKAQNTVADNAGSGLPPPPSEAELDRARTDLGAKKGDIERLERAHEVAALVRKGQELRQEMSGLSGPTPADAVRPAQMEIVKFAADHDMRSCPACGIALPEPFRWPARLGAVEEKMIARERVLEGYRAVHAKLEDVKADLRRHRYDAQSPLDHPDGVLIEAIIAGNEDGAGLDEARGDLAAAQQIYDEMQRTKGAWDQIRRARDLAAEEEEDVRSWEALITALKRAVGELLDRSVATFIARVQAHLPDSWHFALQLRDGEKEVCRYGLAEPPSATSSALVLRTALSGAQWATVTVAIACVLIESQNLGEDGVAIIVPEDRAWDAGALSEVLTALAKAPCQVIVATTTKPDPLPPGWLILETDHEGRIASRTETVALKKRAPAAEPAAPAPPAPPPGTQAAQAASAPKRRGPGRPPKPRPAANAQEVVAVPVVAVTVTAPAPGAVPPELE